MIPPLIDFPTWATECPEETLIQASIAEPAIWALDKVLLPWLARRDEAEFGVPLHGQEELGLARKIRATMTWTECFNLVLGINIQTCPAG